MTDEKQQPQEIEWYGDTIKQKIESALIFDRLNNILQRFGQQMTQVEVATVRLAMAAQTIPPQKDETVTETK